MIHVHHLVPEEGDFMQEKLAEWCKANNKPFRFSVVYAGCVKPKKQSKPTGVVICSGHFLPAEYRPVSGGWDLH